MNIKSRNEFLLQLTSTEATISTYFNSCVHRVFDASILGFHDIVRGTFKATLQSEKNALTDRLSRINENLREVSRIDSVLDRQHIKGTLLTEMFKSGFQYNIIL